ncbi:MAG: DUF92 domain-containing protein [archaeon]
MPLALFTDFSLGQAVAAVLLLLVFSFFTFSKKTLSLAGIVFGNIAGIIVFLFGGFAAFLAIAVFFALGEASTIFSRKQIKKMHEQRTPSNIVGNSGAAIIALLFGSPLGFFGAISAALSDTASSEIGMLSKKKPRLITDFREVPIGTNGGITSLGLVAGILGAAIIGAIYFFQSQSAAMFSVVTVAGISGSVADSLLGALFEGHGRLSNSQVNFIATLCGALVAVFLGAMI